MQRSTRIASTGPEGIGRTAVVVSPNIDWLFRSDGESISSVCHSCGMWQVAGGAVHSAIDQAQRVSRASHHVPLRFRRTAGDPGGRAVDVIGMVDGSHSDAKTIIQICLSPLVEEG